MSDHLTTREFDQFRTDDREWKQKQDDRLDTFFSTLAAQDKRIGTLESASSKTAATNTKIIAGVSAIVTAVINGIIASFSGGK